MGQLNLQIEEESLLAQVLQNSTFQRWYLIIIFDFSIFAK